MGHAIFSVLSMYTHNLGMFGAFAIYVLVLFFALIQKDRKKFLSFFLSGIVCAVLYLPWLAVIMKQFGNVTDHYWKGKALPFFKIKALCISSILFFDTPMLASTLVENTLSILFKLLILFFILKNLNIRNIKSLSDLKNAPLFSKEKRTVVFKGVFLALLFVLPILTYEIIVRTVYPFVAIRYYLIFTGTAIVFFAVIFSKIETKVVPLLCAVGLIFNTTVIHMDIRKQMQNAGMTAMIDRIRNESEGEDICFLHSHEFSLGIMSYFFPDAKHYIYDGTWTVLNDLSVFSNEPVNIGEIDNIKDYTDHFYTFSPFFENDEYMDTAEYFKNDPNYECSKLKRYDYPLTVTMERVELKQNEKSVSNSSDNDNE